MIKLEIEKVLKEKNKSKYWLIKKLHTSYAVINRLIKGETATINFDMLDRMLYYLECTPRELIIYEKEELKERKNFY